MKTLRIGIATALALAGLAAQAAPSKPITLAYKVPKQASLASPTIPPELRAAPVKVDVIDARGDGDPLVIGAQTEKGVDIYLWRSKQDVAPAVSGFLATMLKGWSVSVAGSGASTLSVKLLRYWVNEKSETFGSNYRATVRLSVSLLDRTGAPLWTHEAEGTAGHSAVDGRESVCNDYLSLALYDAMTQALGSTGVAAPASPAAPIVVEPQTLLDELVRLKAGGVADDVLLAYAKQRKVSRPLSIDEILAWKNAGMPDAVIKLAVE